MPVGMKWSFVDFVALIAAIIGFILIFNGNWFGWILVVIAALIALWSRWTKEGKKLRQRN